METICTNSIPQGVVNQVQVIDNDQPVKVLQRKVTSNDVALNHTFKETAGQKIFGQETLGAGLPGNFFTDASVKYRFNKLKLDLEMDADNFFNIKTYKNLYLSANMLSANSYSLPGRIVLVKALFNL